MKCSKCCKNNATAVKKIKNVYFVLCDKCAEEVEKVKK